MAVSAGGLTSRCRGRVGEKDFERSGCWEVVVEHHWGRLSTE